MMTKRHPDDGFTLIELLLVILVLAILATIVVTSVRGLKVNAEDVACANDSRTLFMAAESYFAQQATSTIPPTGLTADRFELTLVGRGLLRQPSEYYDLDTDGDLVQVVGSPCTP